MPNADEKTVKMRAYSGKEEKPIPQSNLSEAQDNALELVKKKAQLEEEKKKSLECQRTVDQLQARLKTEQAKTNEMAGKLVELEAKVRELAVLETKAKELVLLDAKVKELNEVLDKLSNFAGARQG